MRLPNTDKRHAENSDAEPGLRHVGGRLGRDRKLCNRYDNAIALVFDLREL